MKRTRGYHVGSYVCVGLSHLWPEDLGKGVLACHGQPDTDQALESDLEPCKKDCKVMRNNIARVS